MIDQDSASPASETKPQGDEGPALTAGPATAGDRLGVPAGAARMSLDPEKPNPSYVFLVVVSLLSLGADIASKSWAEKHLDRYPGTLEVWRGYLTLVLAKNRGGAWGLLQTTSENVRRPFFMLVSVAAIAFLLSLYPKLMPKQTALKWGVPLVIGGAIGNFYDRVRLGHVIDFIDAHILYRGIEYHWPTFNVADIVICVGVGLMALDMFGSKRGPSLPAASRVPPAQSGEPTPSVRP